MARTVATAPTLYRWDSPSTRVFMYATVASGALVPTRVEMDASSTIDITGLIVEVQGFETDIETTTVSAWGSDALPQTVSGPRTIADSTLITKASRDHLDLRQYVDPGEIVWLSFLSAGDTPGAKQEVWKVECSNHTASKAGGNEGRLTTKFNIIDGNESATIPAAA